MITKQELCRQIIDDMLAHELLNEADAYSVLYLQQEAEQIISRHLEDYVLVCRAGILKD